MNTHVIILAAGKGTRMQSNKPKVLAPLAQRPLLSHVIDTAQELQADAIHIVIGHGAKQVKQAFPSNKINWCLQSEQLGTGHAVKIALPEIPDDGNVIVLYGDVPLIQASTLVPLLDSLETHSLALLTAVIDNPIGYGRISRTPNQKINGIVEQKDANAEQLAIHEINTGILAAKSHYMKDWLARINSNNSQNEYYLTDVVALAYADNCKIFSAQPNNINEIDGINSKAELARTERVLQTQLAQDCMQRGLTILDPKRFDLRGTFEFGQDCLVDINCVFNGDVKLGNNVTIHANCVLSNCEIDDNSVIHPNTVLEDCSIGQQVNIGPFARVRPGTKLDDEVKIGNFVELKNAQLSNGSKVNHLSYIGDTKVGQHTNIGAGVITCNYDGANKHKTEIGDDAFIGSDSQLIAPVKIGDKTTIAAGSTITGNVPQDHLAVARSKQRNLAGWKRPVKIK